MRHSPGQENGRRPFATVFEVAMAHFVILTDLAENMVDARAAAIPAHRAYLAQHATRLLAVGPTVTDDGGRALGSVYLLEAADRSEVEQFVANDPMTLAGARERVQIHRWQMSGYNRVYPLGSYTTEPDS